MKKEPLTHEQIWGEPESKTKPDTDRGRDDFCPHRQKNCSYWIDNDCKVEFCVLGNQE